MIDLIESFGFVSFTADTDPSAELTTYAGLA